MLRALAGYFFGGTQDDAPSVPVECETQEVNDWLVVNMPDQPEVDLEFGESEVDPEFGDLEIPGDMEPEDEEDDVLSSLSLLMTPDEVECKEAPCAEIACKELSILPITKFRCRRPLEHELKYFPSRLRQFFKDGEDVSDWIMTSQTGWCSKDKENVSNEERDLGLDQLVAECFRSPFRNSVNERYLESTMRLMNGFQMNKVRDNPEKLIQKGKDIIQLLRERNGKSRVTKTSSVTCHPVYSNTYVNHRNPALSPKTDLLQRIKELEPEQQASERALKKHITRGQLNRQNKNYIYDTSTKKNRRKNLQRNPSGANNNRKC